MKKISEFFRDKSIQWKIFIRIFTLSTLIIFSSYIFFQQEISQLIESYSEQVALQAVERTALVSDFILEDCDHKITDFFDNRDVINTMVIPSLNDYFRNASVIDALGTLSNNTYVECAYFYSTWLDTVFANDGTLTPLPESLLAQAFEVYNTVYASAPGFGEGYLAKSILVLCDGQVYLFREFGRRSPTGLATVCLQMDMEAWHALICSDEIATEQAVLLTDTAGNILLSTDPYGDVALDPALIDGHTRVPLDGITYVTAQAEYSSMVFLYEYRSPVNALSVAMKTSLSTALLIAFVACAISYYTSRKIYAPTRELFEIVNTFGKAPEGAHLDGKDEYDFLGSVFQMQNEELNAVLGIIADIRPRTEELLLFKAFHENRETISPSEFEETARYIGLTNLYEPRFNVMVFWIDEPTTGGRSGENDKNMRILALKSVVEKHFDPSLCLLKISILDAHTLVCLQEILDPGFSPEQEMQRLYAIRTDCLRYCGELFTLPVAIAIGDGYTPLDGVLSNYRKTRDKIQYQLYTNNHMSKSLGQTELVSPQIFGKHVLAQIREQNTAEVKEKLKAFTLELENQPEGISRLMKSEYENLVNILLEHLVDMSFILDNFQGVFIKDLHASIVESNRYANIQEIILRLFTVVETIQESRSNDYHRYTKETLLYIQREYSNSDLSIQDISSYVGTNPTYLSRVFKADKGQTIIEFINQYRLMFGALLLLSTKLPVKDIGAAVGFATVNNFIQCFKKVEGCTPKQFREGHG